MELWTQRDLCPGTESPSTLREPGYGVFRLKTQKGYHCLGQPATKRGAAGGLELRQSETLVTQVGEKEDSSVGMFVTKPSQGTGGVHGNSDPENLV